MISHVPSPLELMIRRMKRRVGDWMDRRFVTHVRVEVAQTSNAVQAVQKTIAQTVPVSVPEEAARLAPMPIKQRSKPRTRRASKPVQGDLPRTIARAINDGRASGSQRVLARTFKTSKTTVFRAQKLARQLSEMS